MMKNFINIAFTIALFCYVLMLSCVREGVYGTDGPGNIMAGVVVYNKNYKLDTTLYNYLKNKSDNYYNKPSGYIFTKWLQDSVISIELINDTTKLLFPNIVKIYPYSQQYGYLSDGPGQYGDNSIGNIKIYDSTDDLKNFPVGKVPFGIFITPTYYTIFDPTTINNLDIADQEKNFLKQYATTNPPKQFRVYIKTNLQQKKFDENYLNISIKQYIDTLDILYDFNDKTVNPYPLISRKSPFWAGMVIFRFSNQPYLGPPYGQIPEEN
ncbi:MAG: hypothetical protein ORN58_02895 [Sediminibacterium sp.]|nr:hypothetical protein [Sediminibacterium sp.]